MPRSVWIACIAVLLVSIATPARGDLVVSIGSTSVAEGGSGTVDILLTSTASAILPDMINFYGFKLQITNNGVDNTQLAFSANQDFGYISNVSLNPAYVFLGDSSAAQPPPSPIGAPSQTVYPNDTFSGGDSTASGNPVSLSAGTTFLLASLKLTTLTGAPPSVNDSFTISLIPPSGNGSSAGNATTFFDNFDFNTGAELSATPFTSTPGTVTIIAAAVPEPASIIYVLSAMLILGGAQGVRRLGRRQAAYDPARGW
jgi:hypothetical protein